LVFISQKTTFFIVTAVKTSNLTNVFVSYLMINSAVILQELQLLHTLSESAAVASVCPRSAVPCWTARPGPDVIIVRTEWGMVSFDSLIHLRG
jgi:hypothetical protein